MSTKKILSIAAASAIIVTGLNALELSGSNPSGPYVGGQDVNLNQGDSELNITDVGAVLNANGERPTEKELLDAGALLRSKDLRGDALIYPFYRDDSGWGTEITVRNTTPNATVAKAVLYRNDDSQEMIDFNIYLSPFDSATFTIKDGKITTSDRSFAGPVTDPGLARKKNNDGTLKEINYAKDIVHMVGSEKAPFAYQIGSDIRNWTNKGYVTIYGMAQHNDGDKIEEFTESDLNYHRTEADPDSHAKLWKDYRQLLDTCRGDWRQSYSLGKFVEGSMMVPSISPNTVLNCAPEGTVSNTYSDVDLHDFTDVAENTLTGTVRLYNEGEGSHQARDLILPATALRNFTSNQMMLWSEGEWAAIQDRRLVVGDNGNSVFNVEGIRIDAKIAFYTKSAYFTFSSDPDKKTENKLIVTQPMKRVLMHLLDSPTDSNYWEHFNDSDRKKNDGTKLKDYCLDYPDKNEEGYYSSEYGGFNINDWVFDNDELLAGNVELVPLAPITSPYTTSVTKYSINCEVAELGDKYFQRDAELVGSDFAYDTDGFAYVNFTRGDQSSGIPAIITQMTGSKVGGVAQTNWIYAPTIK